jgi:hypothetical protein
MVAGEAVPPDGPAAQPARPIRAGFGFSIFRNHPEIISPGHAPLTLASEIWPSAAGTKKRAPEGTRFF